VNETRELALNPKNRREREIMVVEREFALQQRKANMMCQSTIVPKDYQGSLPNCMIAMEMAQRLNTGELEIMQNLHIIHGRPSFSAKYLIARINASGILKGRLKFEFEDLGEKEVTYTEYSGYGQNKTKKQRTQKVTDKRCRAIGIEAETGETIEGPWISIEIAVKEGWYTKSGSKWQTIPDLMLTYRAASFWASINAPEATLGMITAEESGDIREEKDITPSGDNVSDINAMILDNKKSPAEDGKIVDSQINEVVSDQAAEGTGVNVDTGEVETTQESAVSNLDKDLEKPSHKKEADKG